MPASPVISLSQPSFSSYSNSDNNNLSEIAARVVEEFRAENGDESEFFEDDDEFCDLESDENFVTGDSGNEKSNVEEEFEFEFVPGEAEFSPISADEIFYNGQIRPIFPIFNRNLLLGDVDFGNGRSNLNSTAETKSGVERKVSALPAKIRLPLRKLLIEERESQSSCSSSEADEMDGIPPGTYCVWRPKAASSESSSQAGKCKKSNSTGWSKRWKLRDLVHRSNSDGKDTFVFLTKGSQKLEMPVVAEAPKTAGKLAAPPQRPYLPYRKDFVGFFANVNGLSRGLQPF